jgi:hypothetical protein
MVYRALQSRPGRTVALKVLAVGATADPLARERFERVSRTAGLPRAADEVFAAVLAAEPGRLSASAGEFARRLGAACRGRGAGVWARACRARGVRGMGAGAAGVLLLAAWSGRDDAAVELEVKLTAEVVAGG